MLSSGILIMCRFFSNIQVVQNAFLSSHPDTLNKQTVQLISRRILQSSKDECDMNTLVNWWFNGGVIAGLVMSELFLRYLDLSGHYDADLDIDSQTISGLILLIGTIGVALLSTTIGFFLRFSEKLEIIRSALDESETTRLSSTVSI